MSLEAFFSELTTRQPWRADAACRGKPTEWWMPSTLRVPLDKIHLVHVSPRARALCESCVVRAACLEWAIANDEHGYWGGTSRRERLRQAA